MLDPLFREVNIVSAPFWAAILFPLVHCLLLFSVHVSFFVFCPGVVI